MKNKSKREWNYNKYIFAALRRIFRWSPERRKVLNDAETKNGRFLCAKCRGAFIRKRIAVDHTSPVVDPLRGFQGWDVFVARLFTPVTNLQVLCKSCHRDKTAAENSIRRQKKAEAKAA